MIYSVVKISKVKYKTFWALRQTFVVRRHDKGDFVTAGLVLSVSHIAHKPIT